MAQMLKESFGVKRWSEIPIDRVREIIWLECLIELEVPPAPGVSYVKDGWESGPVNSVVWDGDAGEYRVYVREGKPDEPEEPTLDWFSAWFRAGWRCTGMPWGRPAPREPERSLPGHRTHCWLSPS